MRVLAAGTRQTLRLLAFSPDGRWLTASAEWSPDGRRPLVRQPVVWDLTAIGSPAWAGSGFESAAGPVFSPDGRHLLVTSEWRTHRLAVGTWATDGLPDLDALHLHAIAADGRVALFVTVAEEPGEWVLRYTRLGPGGWAEAWRLSGPGGPQLLTLGDSVNLLDPTGSRVALFHFTNDEIGTGPCAVRSYDGAAGGLMGEWSGDLPYRCSRRLLGPGGLLVCLKNRALFAVRLDEPGSASVKRLTPSGKHFTDAAFSPDGRWLATTSNDALVTLWDTATWQPARQYEWGIGRLRSVAFSPDGTLCAAGSDTGRVVVWDFDG